MCERPKWAQEHLFAIEPVPRIRPNQLAGGTSIPPISEVVCCTSVGNQDVVLVLDAVSALLRDSAIHRSAREIADDVQRLREAFLQRGGRSPGEVAALSRASLIAIQLGELVRATDDFMPGFWSENRAFASIHDVGAFACRKMLHVLRPYLEFQDDGVSAHAGLDEMGRDASFACFLAHAASVRSARVRQSARMLASLTCVLLAPDEWRWQSLLPPKSDGCGSFASRRTGALPIT